MKTKFYIEISYNDDSEFGFDVVLYGDEAKIRAELSMITRGTLMASSGKRAIAYNEEGFDICSYVK